MDCCGPITFFDVGPLDSFVPEPTDAGNEIFFVLPSLLLCLVLLPPVPMLELLLSCFSASPASSEWSKSSWRGTEAGRGVTLPDDDDDDDDNVVDDDDDDGESTRSTTNCRAIFFVVWRHITLQY